jgi:uncharacterized protein (UPF0305 family)
MFVVM